MQIPEVDDYIVGLLLRYFREGRNAALVSPRTEFNRDLSILRLHWAISPQVERLCRHVYQNRHEAQSSMVLREREDDCVVKGRLDSLKTLRRRQLTGNPNGVVFYESTRSYATGPNQVLVWTLQQAYRLAQRFQAVAHEKSSYAARVRDISGLLRAARNVAAVAQAISEWNPSVRPSRRALAQAAASRKPLYRLAYGAYAHLLQIETGDEAAIEDLLKHTVISPLETWRSFEFALGLAIGESLANRLGSALHIQGLGPSTSEPILTVGRFAIYWQSKTTYYQEPPFEPSEIIAQRILSAYDLQFGEDRPDIVVIDRISASVASIGEAKFFSGQGDVWKERLRDAVGQIVRYARGYTADMKIDSLLKRSLICLWIYPTDAQPRGTPDDAPIVVDFNDLRTGRLTDWCDRVIGRSDEITG